MWTCPKCGTKVDPSFDVCWMCGTTADGVEDPTFFPADLPALKETSPLDLDMPKGNEPLAEPDNTAGGELVECYWALDLMQAKFLADLLTDNGIPAVADLHDMHDALGSMSSGPRSGSAPRTCPGPRIGSIRTTGSSRPSTAGWIATDPAHACGGRFRIQAGSLSRPVPRIFSTDLTSFSIAKGLRM